MKRVTLFVVFVLLAGSIPAFAQSKLRISGVSVGSGESPVVSGLSGTVRLKDESGHYIEVTTMQTMAWVMGGKDLGKGRLKANLYGTLGHMEGAPFVAPFVNVSYELSDKVSVSALSWPAFFVGREPMSFKEDGVKNPENLLVGWFDSWSLNVANVSLSMTRNDFLDLELNWLPGVTWNQPVGDHIKVNLSATWNSTAERMMYFIGATWTPPKK